MASILPAEKAKALVRDEGAFEVVRKSTTGSTAVFAFLALRLLRLIERGVRALETTGRTVIEPRATDREG